MKNQKYKYYLKKGFFGELGKVFINKLHYIWYEYFTNIATYKEVIYEIPRYGDLMHMEDFVEYCENGSFTDDDGEGNYAYKDGMTDKVIEPSDVTSDIYDKSYSYIVWFNK